MGGPEMAPQTPQPLVAPRRSRGAPRPHTLVAPRRSRGAPRPHTLVAPRRSRRPPRYDPHLTLRGGYLSAHNRRRHNACGDALPEASVLHLHVGDASLPVPPPVDRALFD